MKPAESRDEAFCGLQEWSAYAQTKTARHKLTKFLKDHGHLLESDQAQSAASSPCEAASQNGASLNGASSAAFRDVQVSCPTLFPDFPAFVWGFWLCGQQLQPCSRIGRISQRVLMVK